MFRTQQNVPSVYIDQSRDFQLLCRLLDCSQNAIKYDIDTIVDILDASTARDNLLQLLCSKVGFFPSINIDSDILKYIVAAFPYLLRYKGTEKGLEYAVNAVLKAEFRDILKRKPRISINQYDEGCQVIIDTDISDYNRQALEEVLKYVMPIGYTYIIRSRGIISPDKDLNINLVFKDSLSALPIERIKLGKVADADSMYVGENYKEYTESINENVYGNTSYGDVYGTTVETNGYHNPPTESVNWEASPKPTSTGLIDPRYIGYGRVVSGTEIKADVKNRLAEEGKKDE